MPVTDFITSIYYLAALALIAFVLTGLLTNNKAERAAEFKTMGLCLLNAPLVLQGVWLVILLVRIGIALPFDIVHFLQEADIPWKIELPCIFLIGTLLLPFNVWLLHKAQTTAKRFAAGCWQGASTIVGSILLTNLACNFLFVESGNSNVAPWLSYTHISLVAIAVLAVLSLCCWHLISPNSKRNIGLRYFALAVSLCIGLLLAVIVLVLLSFAIQYVGSWALAWPIWEPLMDGGIRLSLVLLIGALNGYMLKKTIRTKKWWLIAIALVLCIVPLCVCGYHCIQLMTVSFLSTVISFIVNLFALLVLAILMAFTEDSLPKQKIAI